MKPEAELGRVGRERVGRGHRRRSRLLFLQDHPSVAPSGREVFWTWAVWVPIAVACFYTAWGYVASGADDGRAVSLGIIVGLVGLMGLVRPIAKTLQRQRRR